MPIRRPFSSRALTTWLHTKASKCFVPFKFQVLKLPSRDEVNKTSRSRGCQDIPVTTEICPLVLDMSARYGSPRIKETTFRQTRSYMLGVGETQATAKFVQLLLYLTDQTAVPGSGVISRTGERKFFPFVFWDLFNSNCSTLQLCPPAIIRWPLLSTSKVRIHLSA